MNVLWIVLGILFGLILLVAFLFFFGKVRLRIRYINGKLQTKAYVCGIPFNLLEDEEEVEKKNLSRCRNPERALKKELKRQKRAAKRAYREEVRKKKRIAKRALARHRNQRRVPKTGLKEDLQVIWEILKTFRERTRGRILIRVRKMQIRVGSEDAAKTAILYGVILQSVSCILEWIDKSYNTIHRNDGDMEIVPDYLSDSCRATVDIECSMYISQFLEMFINLMMTREEKPDPNEKAAQKLLNNSF